MKRILVIMTMSLVMIGAYAQEHLSFKGIPVEGSMKTFCKKLESKGFTAIGSQGILTLFTGEFTGREVCVGVMSTNDGKNVLSAGVLFPASGEWQDLVSAYNYYKNLYERKYGKPLSCIENNPAQGDSNAALMGEVHNGTAEYVSIWKIADGSIVLKIEKSNFYEGQVMISYMNNGNIESKLKQDMDDI